MKLIDSKSVFQGTMKVTNSDTGIEQIQTAKKKPYPCPEKWE